MPVRACIWKTVIEKIHSKLDTSALADVVLVGGGPGPETFGIAFGLATDGRCKDLAFHILDAYDWVC